MSNAVSVSIIMCAFNAEKFVSRCMDSLLSQTVLDFEIVLVNDGSTDDTPKMFDFYEAQHPNIVKVVHQNNTGLYLARLAGIRLAGGEYIGFVDADDWVEDSMYERMLHTANEENACIVLCHYFEVFQHSLRVVGKKGYPAGKQLNSMDLLESGFPLFVCNKLFKRDVLGSLDPRLGIRSQIEDVCIMSQALQHSIKVALCDEHLYYYLQHEASDSSSEQFAKKNKIYEYFSAMDALFAFSWDNEEYAKRVHSYLFRSLYWGLTSSIRSCFTADYIDYMKSKAEHLDDNPYITNLDHLLRFVDRETIPKRLIVFGDGKICADEFAAYNKESLDCFTPDYEALIVHQSIETAPDVIKAEAKKGSFDFVREYFIAKHMHEHGGVYVHPSVRLNMPLGMLRANRDFFSVSPGNPVVISTHLFGCAAGSVVMERVLKTYESESSIPLSLRIEGVLRSIGITHLRMFTRSVSDDKATTVYHILDCYTNFSETNIAEVFCEDKFQMMKKGLMCLSQDEAGAIKTFVKDRGAALDKRARDAENKLRAVLSSTSWKITAPLRSFVDKLKKLLARKSWKILVPVRYMAHVYKKITRGV